MFTYSHEASSCRHFTTPNVRIYINLCRTMNASYDFSSFNYGFLMLYIVHYVIRLHTRMYHIYMCVCNTCMHDYPQKVIIIVQSDACCKLNVSSNMLSQLCCNKICIAGYLATTHVHLHAYCTV